jgi:23S rRNA U2552 (ribose-2'-O)-methylase RlmE/FtsJ
MEKIGNILLKYKTDKNHGTIKNIYKDLDTWEVIDNPEPHIGHTYGDSYDEIFETFDRDGVLNILEIGIQRGGSLLAWKDYFKNAEIYGVDIVDVVIPEYRKDFINYIFSDVKDPKVKEELKDIKFDIIIDDGSHQINDIIFVVKTYVEQLKVNGYLIVEDCRQTTSWANQINRIVSDDFVVTKKEMRTKFSGDNNLIIIKRVNG